MKSLQVATSLKGAENEAFLVLIHPMSIATHTYKSVMMHPVLTLNKNECGNGINPLKEKKNIKYKNKNI